MLDDLYDLEWLFFLKSETNLLFVIFRLNSPTLSVLFSLHVRSF